MSDDDKKDLLGKYSGKPLPPLKLVEKASSEEREYHAMKEEKQKGRQVKRFMLYDSEGNCYLCSYAYFIEAVLNKAGQLILTMSNRLITIEGEKLSSIVSKLADERIKELHVFDSAKHDRPAKGQPVIESMTLTSL